jgi:hypothetical protein
LYLEGGLLDLMIPELVLVCCTIDGNDEQSANALQIEVAT